MEAAVSPLEAGDRLLGDSLGVLTPLAQGVMLSVPLDSPMSTESLLVALVFLGGWSTLPPSPLVCLLLNTRPSVTTGTGAPESSLSLSTLARDCLLSVTSCDLLEAG